MLSKRASLERQEYSFHTLTVYIKWSALTFCQNGGTFSQRSPRDPPPPPYNKSFIDFWYWRSFRTKSPTPKCHICFDASFLFVLNLRLGWGCCILVLLKYPFIQICNVYLIIFTQLISFIFYCYIVQCLDKFDFISSYICVDTESCTHSHRCGPELLLFLCNQLTEQDAWWDRLLTDAKSLLMLCGEVK